MAIHLPQETLAPNKQVDLSDMIGKVIMEYRVNVVMGNWSSGFRAEQIVVLSSGLTTHNHGTELDVAQRSLAIHTVHKDSASRRRGLQTMPEPRKSDAKRSI